MKQQDCKRTGAEIDEIFSSEFFKIFGEPVRFEILKFLVVHGESDIGTIAEGFPQDRSVISRHLKTMLASGLVVCTKVDRRKLYYVNGIGILETLEAVTCYVRQLVESCED